MWLLFGLLSALFLGCYDISKKLALTHNAVIPVLCFSVVGCALLLSPCWILSSLQIEGINDSMFYVPPVGLRAHVLICIKAVIVLLSWVFAYMSMKHLPLTIVAPVNATRPAWTLLGALLIFAERLSPWQWVGVLLILVSFMMFSLVGRKEGISFVHNKWIYCLLVATFLGAVSGLYDKYLMRQVPRMAVQAYYVLYQAVMMLVIWAVWRKKEKEKAPFRWTPALLAISVFLVLSDYVYFYALALPDSLISVLSSVRRAGVIVPFLYGALVLHDNNPRLKALCLLGVLGGICCLLYATFQV